MAGEETPDLMANLQASLLKPDVRQELERLTAEPPTCDRCKGSGEDPYAKVDAPEALRRCRACNGAGTELMARTRKALVDDLIAAVGYLAAAKVVQVLKTHQRLF